MEYSNNLILAELSIKKGQNKKQRLINSFENFKREHPFDWDWDNILVEKNEEQIKLCEIFIDSKKINFTYFYTFNNYGNYKIQYYFKLVPQSINFLFANCESITFIDFANFKIYKMKSISHLFYGSKSLISADINNIISENIIDMGYTFSECHSLQYFDLTNFKTKNVMNMRGLFNECKNLEEVNIKNFDTRNLKYMDYI